MAEQFEDTVAVSRKVIGQDRPVPSLRRVVLSVPTVSSDDKVTIREIGTSALCLQARF